MSIAAPHCTCSGPFKDMALGPCAIHGSELTRMELDASRKGAAHWKAEADRLQAELREADEALRTVEPIAAEADRLRAHVDAELSAVMAALTERGATSSLAWSAVDRLARLHVHVCHGDANPSARGPLGKAETGPKAT